MQILREIYTKMLKITRYLPNHWPTTTWAGGLDNLTHGFLPSPRSELPWSATDFPKISCASPMALCRAAQRTLLDYRFAGGAIAFASRASVHCGSIQAASMIHSGPPFPNIA